jgi:hypothetical protein
VEVHPGSVAYLEAAAAAGLRQAVVSPAPTAGTWSPPPGWNRWSAGGRAGRPGRGAARCSRTRHLLAGAKLLGSTANAAVFEDALAGASPRAGGFGYVIAWTGWARPTNCGRTADDVVSDLADLMTGSDRMIRERAYPVEPWHVRETRLDLDVLAQSESVFALSNGHVGLRGTWTRVSRTDCPAPT